MKRIYRSLLLSALVVGGSLTAAHAQTPAGGRIATKPASPYQASPAGMVVGGAVPVAPPPMPVSPAPVPPIPGAYLPEPNGEPASEKNRTVTVPSAGDGIRPVVHSINSSRLVLDFDLKGQSPSSIGKVELWYTRNRQTWRKYPRPMQIQGPSAMDVSEDGLYGFTVLARNSQGTGPAEPRPGDAPQVWVEVDTTRPEVRLLNTQTGVTDNQRTLRVAWKASDRNLVQRPITLSYAEQPQGPWTEIATNLENTGHYTWHLPSELPKQLLVRVVATDSLGNVGEDRTTLPAPGKSSGPTATRHVSRNGIVAVNHVSAKQP